MRCHPSITNHREMKNISMVFFFYDIVFARYDVSSSPKGKIDLSDFSSHDKRLFSVFTFLRWFLGSLGTIPIVIWWDLLALLLHNAIFTSGEDDEWEKKVFEWGALMKRVLWGEVTDIYRVASFIVYGWCVITGCQRGWNIDVLEVTVWISMLRRRENASCVLWGTCSQ